MSQGTKQLLVVLALAIVGYVLWRRALAAKAAAQAHAQTVGQVTAVGNIGTTILSYYL